MLLILHTLLACTSDDEPTEETAAPIATADTAEAIDTGWSPGDYGAFQVWTDRETGETFVGAVAVQTTPGFVNLPQCLLSDVVPTLDNGTPCLPQLPQTPGDFVDFDPSARVDLEFLRTRYLGEEPGFGPFPANFIQDEDTQAVMYLGQANIEAVKDRTMGPAWGGNWPEYIGEEDVFVTEQLEIISPEADSFTRFTNGSQFVIEWEPRGDGSGIITLEVSNGNFGFNRLYRLADDGLFALDVDSLPWSPLSLAQEVEFVLTRWDRSEIQRFGHVVDLSVTSSVTFSGEYLNVGPREPLRPANACPPAQGLLSLPAGQWWWPFDDLTHQQPTCTVPPEFEPQFPEAIYRVDLPPRTLLTLDYTAIGGDAILGLADNCPARWDTCLDFVHQFNVNTIPDGFDQAEFLSYFNISDRVETLFVFLEAIPSIDGLNFYTFDVQIQELQSPELFNECGDVDPSVQLTSDVYYSQFTAFSNSLNPGAGGCTEKSAPGDDAMAPITIPAGYTLTVGIEMPGADPALYLLTNCNDAFQCPAGADTGADEDEQLSYRNDSGVDQTLFLVIDSATGLQPYFLSVNLTPP